MVNPQILFWRNSKWKKSFRRSSAIKWLPAWPRCFALLHLFAQANPNVPMRNLMRGVSIIENDRRDNSLSIIFEGADWGGIWPLRVYYEGLKALGYDELPTLIYTPQILDKSGSKLSKRMYVGGDEAYRKMYDEYVVNISLLKENLGSDAISKFWEVFSPWAIDPKFFFRDYTVDYLLSVIEEEFKRNKSS